MSRESQRTRECDLFLQRRCRWPRSSLLASPEADVCVPLWRGSTSLPAQAPGDACWGSCQDLRSLQPVSDSGESWGRSPRRGAQPGTEKSAGAAQPEHVPGRHTCEPESSRVWPGWAPRHLQRYCFLEKKGARMEHESLKGQRRHSIKFGKLCCRSFYITKT